MLTTRNLVLRNLAYHARGNLAVLLGVAVGAAVLTGALLVGDSLRGSLRARIERQLGTVENVAFLPRPVRAGLANELPGTVTPVLMLPGSLRASGDAATAPFVGRVTILGVDERFAPVGVSGVNWSADTRRSASKGVYPPIVLSARVAAKLGVKAGEKVRLGLERLTGVPRTSSFAKRDTDEVTKTEELEVFAVLPADAPENDFNLTPNPGAPLNVFVPMTTLSRFATGDSAPVATVLLARGANAADLDAAVREKLQAEDYGLKLREIDRRFGAGGYVSVEATELILTDEKVAAVQAAAKALGMRAEPTVVYVADAIAFEKKDIPYPLIAGVNPAALAPLGPFAPKGAPPLADNEVVLLDWPNSQLNKLAPGTMLKLTYFNPDVEGDGKLEAAELTLRGYIPLSGAARDRNLTPEIKGVTDDRANLFDWDRPPVLPKEKIRERVPNTHPRNIFFTGNKATPMAYLNLATARKLFKSRYGTDTSVRVAPAAGESLERTVERLKAELPKHLTPPADAKDAKAEFRFESLRARLLKASLGGNDFGMLFLGFSCFLIAAALLLVGLLFRLSLDRRAKEIGLLLAAGFSVKRVRRLLLAEGLIVAAVGALLGLAVGVAYNRLLLNVLLNLWPDSEVRAYLRPHAAPESFLLGFGMTLAMAFGALWWSARGLVKVAPPALLRGETTCAAQSTKPPARWLKWAAVGALVVGVACIASGGMVDNPDFRAMTFFGGGGLLLCAALALAALWMRRTRHAVVNGRGPVALARLGTRNAARNPNRSLLTAALLASAAFLLVAVESFRRQPGAEFADRTGGSGGFNVIAESDVPLFQPFDAGPGRADLEKQLKRAFAPKDGDRDDPPETPAFLAAKADLGALEEAFALRLRAGDDASCANLYQATRPRVLGVPDKLIDRGGFKFYATIAKTPEEKANPWLLLRATNPNGFVPVFCEQNTAQWMLKAGLGDTYTMPGDDGAPVKFLIVGTLVDSPFQSELIASADHFDRVFPKQTGYRSFLIRTPADKETAVIRALGIGLRANGFVAQPARDKVAAFQAVIGAYLSTFQLLGGFGLMLGVLGLAVVILRGVWERLGELALLRAVGYRTRVLQLLVLIENGLLLVVGLASGVIAALASVAPHVASGAAVPWARLGGMLCLVLAVGFVVASAATAGILRVPVIPALRKE
ncbi:MAG: FtsX-like permease family protein [Planctomycetes bacterium]|nr:FtsX-like permease family protein [Planctomycetota bacterium]